ncbi:MAG: hypothetical protein WAQ98_30485 [Blastocatellia bacterium]
MQEIIKEYIEDLLKIERIWLFIALATLFCSITLFALGSSPPLLGYLDYSWELALHEFFVTKKQFGKEVIFTYGPYGFLFTKMYHPKTYWLTNLGWLFLALVFWWSTLYIAYKLIKNKWFIFIWFLSLFFIFFDSYHLDNFFTLFFFFFLVINFYIKDNLSKFNNSLLTITVCLIALVKFSFLLIALPLIIFLTINDLLQKNKPIQLIVFSSTLLFLWLFAGQSLFSIPSYIKNALEISIYYNYVMGPIYDASSTELTKIILFFFLCSLTIFFYIWQKENLSKYTVILSSISFIYFLFIVIKAAYTRFGPGHTVFHNRTLCVLAIFYLIICLEEKLSLYIKVLAIVSCLLMLAIYQNHLSFYHKTTLFSAIVPNTKLISENIKNLFNSKKISSEQQYKEEISRLQQLFPLPKLTGSVDVHSYLQLTAIAHNFDYKPRPIFQSYSAYSPYLADINLKYLQNSPPDNIVFSSHVIDERFPSLDDSLCWPEFLTKYDIKELSPGALFLILQHSQKPRDYSFTSEQVLSVNFNENIAVPKMDLGPIWAKIQVEYSTLGNLSAKLYKPFPIYLNVTIKSGEQFKYFLPTPMAETGFLLSPLIRTPLDFTRLASQEWKTQLSQVEIQNISISVEDPKQLWQFSPKIKITFSHLDFPRETTEEITKILTQPVVLQSVDPLEFINLSLQQIQQGDNYGAVISCEKALEKGLSKELAYNNMGTALLNLSLVDEAIEAFEQAIKLSPDFQLAKNNLNFANSIKVNLIDKNKKAENYINLSVVYINVGKFEKSIDLSEKALKLSPNNPTVYNNLCVAYNGLKLWDKAIVVAEQAIKLAPDFQLAKNNLAWAKSQKAESEKKK